MKSVYVLHYGTYPEDRSVIGVYASFPGAMQGIRAHAQEEMESLEDDEDQYLEHYYIYQHTVDQTSSGILLARYYGDQITRLIT